METDYSKWKKEDLIKQILFTDEENKKYLKAIDTLSNDLIKEKRENINFYNTTTTFYTIRTLFGKSSGIKNIIFYDSTNSFSIFSLFEEGFSTLPLAIKTNIDRLIIDQIEILNTDTIKLVLHESQGGSNG